MGEKTRVAVGLSGGVDSSVTAQLLVDQDYDVIGVFMKNWDDSDPLCPAAQDAADARLVAQKIGIPFYSFDFSDVYRSHVFEYFLEQNKKGLTPNPDILCNVFVKFGAFLEEAKKLECEYVATGHYARKVLNQDTGEFELHTPVDTNKDQTYFLSGISQDQLAHALFPLADLEKSEVRKIAEKHGFITAGKKDSTGICFVGKRNYREFLSEYIDISPGDIRDHQSQRIIGKHTGLPFYTIGQRKDLGIGGVQGFDEAPFFLIAKDFEKNEIIVSQNESLLLGESLEAKSMNWISTPPADDFRCEAQIRYRSDTAPCTVKFLSQDESHVYVKFDTPQRAIAPGQTVVFYQGSKCLGGGEIS